MVENNYDYDGLVNGILRQTIYDYRHAVKKLIINKNDEKAKSILIEIKYFLFSDWFKMMTTINPEWFLEQMKNGKE